MKERYLVHEIAKYFGVSCDTVRYYDKLGIISPKKDKRNNYRYYDRGDIICFSYVFGLKNMGLPLNQVRAMLNDSSLEYAADVMEEHEQKIEAKIRELQRLKSNVSDYKRCFKYAMENFGVIKIINSPVLICKEIDEPNGSVIENLKFFEKLTLMHVPLFTFYIDKKLFLSKEFNDITMECRIKFRYALSLRDDESLVSMKDFPYGDCEIINPRKCLTTVIKFYTKKDYSSIIKVKEYIEKNNLEVNGDVLLRAISFKNNIKNNCDYYEVYVPIK